MEGCCTKRAAAFFCQMKVLRRSRFFGRELSLKNKKGTVTKKPFRTLVAAVPDVSMKLSLTTAKKIVSYNQQSYNKY